MPDIKTWAKVQAGSSRTTDCIKRIWHISYEVCTVGGMPQVLMTPWGWTPRPNLGKSNQIPGGGDIWADPLKSV